MIKMREEPDDLALLDDEALMAHVASGSTLALEQLYNRYAGTVYGVALRMLSNADRAEDVVQETFWRIWRRSTTFRTGKGRFAAWLFGIAHNLCIDELRRQRARPRPVYETSEGQILQDFADTGQDVDSITWQAEQRRLIVDALQQLPPDQREVIELAYFGGLSQREIASRLQNPVGTVKTRIRLGLQKIRQFLQGQGISQEDV